MFLAPSGLPTVYPRVCGGTMRPDPLAGSPRVRGHQSIPGPLVTAGLSPRVRGHPIERGLKLESASAVYPRVCGGTQPAHTLSPQTVPACAGAPRERTPTRHRGQVYPRVCGGTPVRPIWAVPGRARVYPRVCGGTVGRSGKPSPGLSPRVRGHPSITFP